MPVDPRKRQKKQERLAARRKSKRHQLVRENNVGLPEKLKNAAGYPVLYSWVTEDFWTQGMGWACLSREGPGGRVAFGLFLVDRFCLGVKNAMADVTDRSTYESQIERKTRAGCTVNAMDPAAVRKLVEGAVAYAQALGLPPHADYHRAKLIFGDIDVSQCQEEFEYGKDGKAFFIAGPHDTPERCRRIMKALGEKVGAGQADFIMPISRNGAMNPASLEGAHIEMLGLEGSDLIDLGEADSDEDEPGKGGSLPI